MWYLTLTNIMQVKLSTVEAWLVKDSGKILAWSQTMLIPIENLFFSSCGLPSDKLVYKRQFLSLSSCSQLKQKSCIC